MHSLKTKTVNKVVQAYIDEEYGKFGGSVKSLCDNGTKFKNQPFAVCGYTIRCIR